MLDTGRNTMGILQTASVTGAPPMPIDRYNRYNPVPSAAADGGGGGDGGGGDGGGGDGGGSDGGGGDGGGSDGGGGGDGGDGGGSDGGGGGDGGDGGGSDGDGGGSDGGGGDDSGGGGGNTGGGDGGGSNVGNTGGGDGSNGGNTGSTDSNTSTGTTIGSTGSTTNTSTSSVTPASTTPAYQVPVDARNSATIANTNARATNPTLPPGTEVNFNGINANSSEFMTASSLGSMGSSSVAQAQAGQATAAGQTATNTYDAALINQRQQEDVAMTAATSAIAASHLVSGRLTELLKPGPDGNWPVWASGAATKAQQLLAARGIDNSSMAGQAIMAAIIDNALPIAQGDSQALVAMDMQNLNNQQQASLFNAQQKGQFLLSNQAADNAAKNFNAGSKNQSDEFFANLATQVSSFNAAQRTAVSTTNAGADNAMEQFDRTMQDSRDRFNAQNDLAVQQANTTWRRQINTTNTAAQNEANRVNALNRLSISNSAYAAQQQQYRDESAWAFTASESAAERQNRLGQIALYQQGRMQLFDANQQAAFQQSFGSFLAGMFNGALNSNNAG